MSYALLPLIILTLIIAQRHTRRPAPPRRKQAVGRQRHEQVPGWVYFLSTPNGGEVDPPDPIRIGSSAHDPAAEPLPGVDPSLVLLDKVYSRTPKSLERKIRAELKPYRRNGGWYDRDVTLAWLDNFQGGET